MILGKLLGSRLCGRLKTWDGPSWSLKAVWGMWDRANIHQGADFHVDDLNCRFCGDLLVLSGEVGYVIPVRVYTPVNVNQTPYLLSATGSFLMQSLR